MTTTDTVTEREAIERVAQLYAEGAGSGDAAKLRQAFHEDAWMYGTIGGKRSDMPIAKMIELLAAQPLDSDGGYTTRIASVEQVGDAAVVRLEEEGCWGSLSFVDFFSLARIDGTWKIVNKTFAHTGGELPG